jgi:hypothetical protein
MSRVPYIVTDTQYPDWHLRTRLLLFESLFAKNKHILPATEPCEHAANMECESLRVELRCLRIQRIELEQEDADRETLQAMDDAIRKRAQQLDRALYRKWWEQPPPVPCQRPCGHDHGSVLRECCKAAASGRGANAEALRFVAGIRPVTTYFSLLR